MENPSKASIDKRFAMSESQIDALTAYIGPQAAAYRAEDVGESFEYIVSFTFNIFGRSISARVISDSSELILEDSMESNVLPYVRKIERDN